MIAVTERSRSAVSALIELAGRSEVSPVPIMEVAERRGIPMHVLEQLFSALRRAGILQSQRGVKGGYSFRRPPRDVTVLAVVETVDGALVSVDESRAAGVDGAEGLWREAGERLADLLREVSIADLVDREARLRSAPMFHI